MRYSVIVPVYNASSTIKRCLDSLLCQNHKSTEIILINDGSTDESGEICKAYAASYPEVQIISVPNHGVSHARNLGLSAARGTYVLFVDSDDYVDASYFEVMDRITDNPDVDLALFGLQFFGKRDFISSVTAGEWTGNNAARTACEWMRSQTLNSLVSKVFKRSIIEQYALRFNESLSISEDLSFVFAYALHSEHLLCDATVIYYVSEEQQGSLSRRAIPQLEDKLIYADAVMRAALHSAEVAPVRERMFLAALARNYYRSAYSASKSRAHEKNAKVRREEISRVCGAFSERYVSPLNAENWVIALPVLLKASRLIDFVIQNRFRT